MRVVMFSHLIFYHENVPYYEMFLKTMIFNDCVILLFRIYHFLRVGQIISKYLLSYIIIWYISVNTNFYKPQVFSSSRFLWQSDSGGLTFLRTPSTSPVILRERKICPVPCPLSPLAVDNHKSTFCLHRFAYSGHSYKCSHTKCSLCDRLPSLECFPGSSML